jgi:hypothetical protein
MQHVWIIFMYFNHVYHVFSVSKIYFFCTAVLQFYIILKLLKDRSFLDPRFHQDNHHHHLPRRHHHQMHLP